MNLSKIENLFEKINECIEFYEKQFIQNKTFTLYLGNGEKVKYSINPDNLPHLLGVNLDFVKTLYNYHNKESYELLKEVCSDAFKLNELFNKEIIKPNQIFSQYIDKKLEGFKDNFKYDVKQVLEDSDFVCTYNSEKSWEVSENNQKYNYIVFKTYPNGKIGLLGLVKKGFQCYAMSNQLFDSIEEAKDKFNELLKNQDITLLTGFSTYNKTTDTNFSWNITINQKTEKIDTLKNYKENFGCNINITNDYEYTLRVINDNKSEKKDNYFTTDDIVEGIVNGKIINRDSYVDSPLLKIIDAWNDYICSGSYTSDDNSISYTETIKNLKTTSGLLKKTEKENEQLKVKIDLLNIENDEIKKQNEIFKSNEEAIIKILKPEN